jgi:hypothetical protein
MAQGFRHLQGTEAEETPMKADHPMYPPVATRHAEQRMQQRGIRAKHRDLLFSYGDRETPAGRGLYRLTFSYGRLRWLVQRGHISRQEAEKCARLTLITDGMKIITNYSQNL